MKTKYRLNKMLVLLVAFISIAAWSGLQAQVVKAFEKRPGNIFNIKGDFRMIGNTNLTLQSYTPGGGNGNVNMIYVDIDGDPNTINSSSAKLEFSTENGANPNCTNVLYAGLYWTGRAHDGTSPNTWTVGGGSANRYNNDQFNGYTLTITSANESGSGDYRRLATYTLTPTSGDEIIFRFRTWRSGGILPDHYSYVTVQVGSGAETEIQGSLDNDWWNDRYTFTFNSPYNINTGTGTLSINSLRKHRSSNTINDNFLINVTSPGKTLDKRKVKFKHSSGNYYTVTADADNIYYPTTNHGYMYSAYADVTAYVKSKGEGDYFVADIALNEGNGGPTGFYGGWGLVVVYENSKMKWRDVTIFDGYAYLPGQRNTYEQLSVSGFNTAQSGQIDLKLGIIAGEGDISITGDVFQIRNHQNTQWISLKHDGNTATNFFRGSIPGTSPRNPQLVNNTGLDIAEFKIDNPNNSVITNSQTSTTFRYGNSNGTDTYIISCIAMAVDAYIPELVPYIHIDIVNGQPFSPSNNTVKPGEEIEYTLEIRNPGTEAINDAVVEIPIPYTATLAGTPTDDYFYGTGTNPGVTTNGSIIWTIGSIPMGSEVGDPADINKTLAKLTFKLRATTECFWLVNDHCVPTIMLEGTGSGVGATTGTPFSNVRFVQGYQEAGECEGEPIMAPIGIGIDADEYVTEHCADVEAGIKVFNFCKNPDPEVTTIQFSQIAGSYPPGTRFYNAIDFEMVDTIQIAVPAEGAIEYTEENSFPNHPVGTATYYALPPGISPCWWELKIEIEDCNLWMGSVGNADPVIDTDWNTPTNWTKNEVPAPGEDVTFATALNNYGVPAVNDLVLDKNRVVGNVTNLSDKKLIIPIEKTLIINGVTNFGTGAAAGDKLLIKSELDKGNGALIFNDPIKNQNVPATVEYDSKSQKVATGTYPREWQYIGTPVRNATPYNVFGPNVSGSKYGPEDYVLIRKYNESKNDPSDIGDKWDDVDVNAEMTGFAGYEVVQPTQGVGVYNFKGTLYVGNFNTEDLGFTSGVYYRGNYIIANSYVAPIYISKLLPADFENLEQGVYLYNTGSRDQWLATSYGTVGEGNPGTFYSVPVYAAPSLNVNQIPSLNGFMVRRLKNAPAGTIPTPGEHYIAGDPIQFNFNYARLEKDTVSIQPTQPMKVKAAEGTSYNKYPLLKVDVMASDGVDRVQLLTVPNTTKGFDNGWDGYKLRTQTDAQIYCLSGTERFQVSSDCSLDGTILGFYNGTNETDFTLKFHFQDMNGVYDLLTITDLETGSTREITDGGTVSFTASKSSPEARFQINASKIITDNSNLESPISILYDKAQYLSVTNNGNEAGTISVYDVTGSLIYESAMPVGFSNQKITLPKGVFIIDAKAAGYRSQIKVIAQ